MLKAELLSYQSELEGELHNILSWWMTFATDPRGGYVGRIDHEHEVYSDAPKGAVLNARILWSFSAGYNRFSREDYLRHADRAYNYIRDHFIDREYGGVYWTVDANGKPLSTKKQVYAIAFAIYALAEYSFAAGNEEAVELAINLYNDLEEHSVDPVKSGYFEAFNRDWSEVSDVRLSEKDANEKKTMNTHLHILEAYTNLYRHWEDDGLRQRIFNLLDNFRKYIVHPGTYHLNLFMDEAWSVRSTAVSYGHDIEASWLLLEAAEVLNDATLIQEIENLAVKMAESSLEGMDRDGGMIYEFDPHSGHVVREKHWWVQSEAMVGFFNAWEISANDRFLEKSLQVWNYAKDYLLDPSHGEWFWGRDESGQIMKDMDKAGLWKCPYHNSRACLELIKRIRNRLS